MEKVIQLQNLKPILPLFKMEGKKAIVTGGAGGIGRSVAAALAELGADVALVDVRDEIAKQNADLIADKWGGRTLSIKCDVSDPVQVDEMISKIVDEFGTVDYAHSNAGIIAGDDNGDMPAESWKRMIDINVNGMFYVNKAVAKYLRGQKKVGAVVNTASMSGHIINRMHGEFRHNVCYTTTKAAVMHLTKAMAMDFCRDGIRFNSVSPGYMYSGIHDGVPQEVIDLIASDVPLKRFGSMQEIGGIVAFLLSDLASYITGTDIIVDGGYCCW